MSRTLRALLAIVGIAGMLTLLAVEASDARPRGSIGSRGSRTAAPPPKTNTTPSTAQPIQRTQTSTTTPAAGAPRASTPAAAPKPGLFNRPGFMGGLLAGVLGAGLIGLLMGQGLFGNLAGLASFIGLAIQLLLIGGVAYLIVRWWRNRSQPQAALAGGPQAAFAGAAAAPRPMQMSGSNGDSFTRQQQQQQQQYQPAGNQQDPGQPVDEIGIKPEDYDTFERLLGEIQTAYSKEDMASLRARVTPEMVGYLSEELAEHASNGVAPKLSNVKLLQGDLAEAWAEGNVEYATVALRYELIDTLVERDTGKVVEGDPNQPTEAVEYWTFMRTKGGKWLLSAIQQVEDEEQGQA